MTISVTLNNLANLQNENTAVSTINGNSAAVTAGFTTALNTQGDQMLGNLDMNSNQIINLPSPGTAHSPVRLVDVTGTGPTLTVPPVGTSGAVVGFLNSNLTFSGTDSFNTITVTTASISTSNVVNFTASTVVVTNTISTPSISGCFGGFKANLGGTAQSWTTPTTNTYQIFRANTTVFNNSSCYNATTWTFTPPAGTKLVNLSAHAWVYNNGATSTTPLNTVVGKWIKNWSVDGNGFLSAAGTDIAAGIAGVALGGGGGGGIQTNSSVAPFIVFSAGGSALSNAWDAPSPGDYYGFFVFSQDIFNASGALMSIDGNVAHSYISGFYFI